MQRFLWKFSSSPQWYLLLLLSLLLSLLSCMFKQKLPQFTVFAWTMKNSFVSRIVKFFLFYQSRKSSKKEYINLLICFVLSKCEYDFHNTSSVPKKSPISVWKFITLEKLHTFSWKKLFKDKLFISDNIKIDLSLYVAYSQRN